MFQAFQAGIRDETYLQLRQILERQYGQTFTIEEVKEISDGLLDYASLLTKLESENNTANKCLIIIFL